MVYQHFNRKSDERISERHNNKKEQRELQEEKKNQHTRFQSGKKYSTFHL